MLYMSTQTRGIKGNFVMQTFLTGICVIVSATKAFKRDDNWGEAEIVQFKQTKLGANAPCHPRLESTATQFQLPAIQCLLQNLPKRQEKRSSSPVGTTKRAHAS